MLAVIDEAPPRLKIAMDTESESDQSPPAFQAVATQDPQSYRLITICGIGGDSQAAKELSIIYTVLNYISMGMVVDHTTDAHRGKLPLYESWGFREVWVDVPGRSLPGRGGEPRVSGLDGGGDPRGAERGRAVGAPARCWSGWAECWGRRKEPDRMTTRLLRSQRRQDFERGRAEGLRTGGQQARAEMIRLIHVSRGIEISAEFLADAAFAAVPDDMLISAALACKDEAAFRTAIS